MANYYQLRKFEKSARRAIIASLVFPSLTLCLILYVALNRPISPLMPITVLVELIFGVISLLLVAPAGRGSPAAFFTILSLAIFALVRTAFLATIGLPYFSCNILADIPIAYLIYLCIESMPEAKQLIRRRRENQAAAARGFPVITPGVPAITPQRPESSIDNLLPAANVLAPEPFQMPADRSITTHYMHAATISAAAIGALSFFSGICLLLIEYIEQSKGEHDAISLQTVLLLFILPAALLLICAWRMGKKELWAYALCSTVAGLLLVRIFAVAFALRVLQDRSAYLPGVFESAKNLPCIYLLIRCGNALRDALENRRSFQREKEIAHQRARGGRQAPELASITPPPPVGRFPAIGDKDKRS